MDEALKLLLTSGGPLGALCILGGFYVSRLQKLLHDTQEARTRDAQNVVLTILSLVEKQHDQLEALVKALDHNTAALRDLRQLLSDELLRRRTGS